MSSDAQLMWLERIAKALENIDRRLASMDEHIDMTGETVGEIVKEMKGIR